MIMENKIYSQIETSKYLENGLSLNTKEKEIRQKKIELTPQEIIDIHNHTASENEMLTLHPCFYNDLVSTFPYFNISEHKKIDQQLWGSSKRVKHACFTFPFEGVEINLANNYVLSHSSEILIPFYTIDSSRNSFDNLASTSEWKGVKAYARQRSPEATTISQFYTRDALKVINQRGLPIILHLPNDLVYDHNELKELLSNFREVKFIIAHMGFPDPNAMVDYQKALISLKNENLFFDTSWSNDTEAIRSVIEILGPDKLLYGSDQPLNLIRVTVVNHPTLGPRVAVGYHYHWADSQEQEFYRNELKIQTEDLTTMHFQSIEAIMQATQDRDEIKNIFRDNAARILKI